MGYEIRLGIFLGIFVVMAAIESAAPRRRPSEPWQRRWLTNLLIVVIDSAAVRLLMPLAVIGAADWAATHSFGLFHLTSMPPWLEGLIAIVVLDCAIYLQHVLSHKVPLFWTIHRVHHVDRDIDVTTGLRFHPIEILLSVIYKMVIVMALGASPMSVLIFEIVLNGSAMFNHANIRLPNWLDRWLRLAIVTPDMHRVHHSIDNRETDSNYGFNLSIWDRIFRTYIPQPGSGHTGMRIGRRRYQDGRPSGLFWSLLLPFETDVERSGTGLGPGKKWRK